MRSEMAKRLTFCLLLLLLFRRDEKQDAAHQVQEDERAHAEADCVGTLALVDLPCHDGHGNHPSKRDDGKAHGYGGDVTP